MKATERKDDIDYASSKLEALMSDVESYSSTIKSEQDTRLKVIDRVLQEVLGWPLEDISTEETTSDGFVDYKLCINQLSRLIVEAKRDGRTFGFENRNPGRAYRLNGPIFKKDAKEGILQAIRYCGAKNTELACVTNGNEWIVFRGSRLGDGKDSLEGKAFLFPSLGAVAKEFSLFYDLLAKASVNNLLYRSYFQEAEGQPIRSQAFSKSLWPPEKRRVLERSSLARDLDQVMTTFFRRLSCDDDFEMMAQCFVVTRESEKAEEKLARITEDLVLKVRELDSDNAEALSQIVQRVHETHRNEFVLLIGTKGAGKSTFVDRFFSYILPGPLSKHCILLRIDLGKSQGHDDTIIDWLNHQLLEAGERTIFGEQGPKYDELQGMFFDEYMRWSQGTYQHLYKSDKTRFKIEFGKHIENRRENRPDEYIRRLLRHVVRVRKNVPCVVFDNADHFTIQFQEKVFQYARALYENEVCLVIMPITDKTSWQLSQQGSLQSFESESFYLPTPSVKRILERRISYLETKLESEKDQKGEGYFLSRGIQLSIEHLQAFACCLQRVFVETGPVSMWLGNLSNMDIRRCLTLCRDVVSSPYIKVDDLLKAYISKQSYGISNNSMRRAIIRGHYDIYPVGQHSFVQNIYALDTEIDTSPLLGLRILRLLFDAQHTDIAGSEEYISVDQIEEYFQAIGIDRRAVTTLLDSLLRTGLCFSYDPTVTDVSRAGKLRLSPSGFRHLTWGAKDFIYIDSMMQITPIHDKDTFLEFQLIDDSTSRNKRDSKIVTFLDYLLKEDAVYTIQSTHRAFLGQSTLLRKMLMAKKDAANNMEEQKIKRKVTKARTRK